VTGNEEVYSKTIAGLVSPDDVARVITFMASDEAKVLRGSVRTA
jgi:hypothetical protein